MGNPASRSGERTFPAYPARTLAQATVPWVPLSEGKSFKPLRFLSGKRGFAELLRLEPGAVIPLHRHTGEVHAESRGVAPTVQRGSDRARRLCL